MEPMAHGYLQPISDDSEEKEKDAFGITNPNLHRRLSDDTEARDIKIAVYGRNSYRYISEQVHDEESTTSEIP